MDHLDHWLGLDFRLLLLTGGSSKLLSLHMIYPLVEVALVHKMFQVSLEGPTGCCEVPLLPMKRAVDSPIFEGPFCTQLVFGKGEEGKVLNGPDQQEQRPHKYSSFCNKLMSLQNSLMPGPDSMHRPRVSRRLDVME